MCGSVRCSGWRWCLSPERQPASRRPSINAIPPAWLGRTAGGIGWKTSQGPTTPCAVWLRSVIYGALSSGNPRASLLRMTPGHATTHPGPCSSPASSAEGVPNLPQLLLWDVLPEEMWEPGGKFHTCIHEFKQPNRQTHGGKSKKTLGLWLTQIVRENCSMLQASCDRLSTKY